MPFVSFGPLNWELPTNRKKRTESVTHQALIKFCKVINPTGLAFHPSFFQEMLKNPPMTGKFLRVGSNVQALLQEAYRKSLIKHVMNTSQGPLPREIQFSRAFVYEYRLKWHSLRMGGIGIILIIGQWGKPRFLIKGKNIELVRECGSFLGLPEPHFEKDRLAVTTPYPKELTQKLADIQVPLGDLLDFLKKYQSR